MCGRFTLFCSAKELEEHFNLVRSCTPLQSYNISPSTLVPVVLLEDDSRILENRHWGLVPYWARDSKLKPINARAETIDTKPFFRSAFKKTRCLIPANGFYEWQRSGNTKHPFYFQLEDTNLMAFAGLWDRWEKDGETLDSCTIITTQANDVMTPVHDRMPVILSPDDYDTWLQDGGRKLLQPYRGTMIASPVSSLVNNPKNSSRDLIEPVRDGIELH